MSLNAALAKKSVDRRSFVGGSDARTIMGDDEAALQNRRNATRSTGPTTEASKQRSRRDAVRHGLCAETVVEIVEDIDNYRGFEAEFDRRSADLDQRWRTG